MAHERLPQWKALSIFSSDALSSVAYGPEQAMIILVAVSGIIAYGYLLPVAIGVFALLIMVALSYAQVAKANPAGGGAYAVAKANLGEMPALIAAAAVFADYILTAAVSVCTGTDAIVSAFPQLSSYQTGYFCAAFYIIEEKWAAWNPAIQLVTVNSQYRLIVQPILNFISELHLHKYQRRIFRKPCVR